MRSVDRRWLPPILIALAVAASAVAYGSLPTMMEFPVEDILPFAAAQSGETLSRELAIFLMPAVALIVWAGFRAAPTVAGQRLGRRLFPHSPDEVTQPAQFERFGKTYETIVLAVVVLILGFHTALLAAGLDRPALAARILPAVLGASLVMIGNVAPRLRPNWVAGFRTRRILEDPQLWRATHRAFGTALVLSGVVTLVVGVAAPRYGLVTGIGLLMLSCVVGFIASARDGR